MVWIAVDVGTSVVKAVAFDSKGCELALAREKTQILRPHVNFAEQSMSTVWNSVVRAVRTVAGHLQQPIEGIVTTAQGDGCWLIDAEGHPTGNAILWNDGRATEIVEHWREIGLIAKAFSVSGSVPYAGLSNAIINWLQTNLPDQLASFRYVLTCNGWIFAQMTGQFVADISDASNPFSDIRKKKYSEQLIEFYGPGSYGHLLPPIAQDTEILAALTPHAAEELGVAANVPVVMAPYDIVSTAYGAGAALSQQACVILGTTICAEALTSDLDLRGEPAGTTIALDNGLYLRAMPTLTGCETLEWVVNLLGLTNIAELDTLAAKAQPGAAGVIFLPYLSPAGERAPFLEPRAQGSFHGLTLLHNREDVCRAVYEGLSFAIRECIEKAAKEITEVRVCGGGARSGFWCQMIADIAGVTVHRSLENEVGARGAFLFALKATGVLTSIAEGVLRYPGKIDTFYPIPEAHKIYSARFPIFKRMREIAREQWMLNEVRT